MCKEVKNEKNEEVNGAIFDVKCVSVTSFAFSRSLIYL